MEEKQWKSYKERILSKLRHHLAQGKVDPDVIDVLDIINSYDEYCSLSSCSGRVIIIKLPEDIGCKPLATPIFKRHWKITLEELKSAFSKIKEGNVWIHVQPPIFHIACKNLDAAHRLMSIAKAAGFKKLGIISVKRGSRVVVEITGSEFLSFPVSLDGKPTLREEVLDDLVKLINYYVKRSKNRLARFKMKLREHLRRIIITDDLRLIKDVKMPEKLAEEIRKPKGRIYETITPEVLSKYHRIYVVGDYVTANVLKIGIMPKLIVIDGKVERKPFEVKIPSSYKMLETRNPAGHITVDAWNTIMKALSEEENFVVKVDGEEDLLAFPVTILGEEGAAMLYGQPGRGCVVVEINERNKRRALKLLHEFELA